MRATSCADVSLRPLTRSAYDIDERACVPSEFELKRSYSAAAAWTDARIISRSLTTCTRRVAPNGVTPGRLLASRRTSDLATETASSAIPSQPADQAMHE